LGSDAAPAPRIPEEQRPLSSAERAFAAVQRAVDELLEGHVAFNAPENMQIGRTQTIQVMLGVGASVADLLSQITSEGNKETASLKVAAKMTATLTGGGAFDISPTGPQMQFVTLTNVTPWAFDVTPKQSGVHELTLALDAIITVEEKEGPNRVNTLTRKIVVEVGWPQTPAEWFEASKKWFENASWLWLTILLPVGGFMMAHWRRQPSRLPENNAVSQLGPPPSSRGSS
jgi:hypothetical protein